jgi:uncharacterized phiE125 gp8 family phage protein
MAYGLDHRTAFASTVRVTGPAALAVHPDEAKAQARVDTSDEDAVFRRHIASAIAEVEKDAQRALVWQRHALRLDAFPDVIELEVLPVLKVESVQYVASTGTTTTLATDQYRVDYQSSPCRIEPAYGLSWPTTRVVNNAVIVTYTAGQAVVMTAATSDTITVTGYTPVNGDVWRVSNTGGALPTGLSEHTDYYIVQASGQTCKLSLTDGGSAVDITATGSGTNFLGEVDPMARQAVVVRVAMEYVNRESMDYKRYSDGYRRLVDGLRWH